MAVRLAINGFGRIGRNFFRASFRETDFEFVAFNDITDARTLAHLLKYDSILGKLNAHVEARDDAIVVDGKAVKILAIKTLPSFPGTTWGWRSSWSPRGASPTGRTPRSTSRLGRRR